MSSTIQEAKANVLGGSYSSVSSIKELSIFKQIVSVYETALDSIQIKQDLNSLFDVVSSMNTPFQEYLIYLKEDYTRIQRDITFNKQLVSKSFSQISSQSPFQTFVVQLETKHQYSFHMVHIICKLFIYAMMSLFLNYNSTQDYTKFKYYIGSLIQQNSWLKDLNSQLIETFVLEKGSPQGQFRQELLDAMQDTRLRSYSLGQSFVQKPQGTILLSIFLDILQLNSNEVISSGKRIVLYMRYIVQFLQAPYMSSYKRYTQSPISSLDEAIKMDIEVFIPLRFINDIRQLSSGYGF